MRMTNLALSRRRERLRDDIERTQRPPLTRATNRRTTTAFALGTLVVARKNFWTVVDSSIAAASTAVIPPIAATTVVCVLLSIPALWRLSCGHIGLFFAG